MSNEENPEGSSSDDQHLVRRDIFGTIDKHVPGGLAVLQHAIRDHFRRICHCGPGNTHCYAGNSIMITNNHYVAAEVVALGSGTELVRGSIKGLFFDDGPGQERRNIEIEDVE